MRAGLWRGPSEKAADCNPEGVSPQNPPDQLWEGDLPPQTPRVNVCRSGPRAVGFVWVTRCLLTWALGPWPPPSCCTLLAGRASGHFWRMGHVASARSWSGSNQTRYWPERDRARSCAAQTQGPGTDRQTPLALRGQTLTRDREERVSQSGRCGASPRLLAYLGVVVGPRRGVGGARVGRELHDGHAGVVDGGVGEPRAVRRPPVCNVRLQDLL